MKSITATNNPFPVEAVATWGEPTGQTAKLAYMESAGDELNSYLHRYPTDEERYGAALAIRGGHGSGKTHFAMWLADQARNMKSIVTEVVYAKIDSASLFDVYRQLLQSITRERLQQVIQQAMLNEAKIFTGRAEATRSMSDKLQTVKDIAKLYNQQNLSPDVLMSELNKRLSTTQSMDLLPRTLLAVSDHVRGESAYQWLLGESIPGDIDAELTRPLSSLGNDGDAFSDVAAANALETIAALYAVAEIPLIIIIDQLEVLFRTDKERLETLYSVLKKMVEQCAHQKALIIIVGTNDGWEGIPRDILPRFRKRKPLLAGVLSQQETKVLLDSKLKPFELPSFSPSSVGIIHNLSGGNPREILRIAHKAYEKKQGDITHIDNEELIKLAENTGTLSDRRSLLLTIADPILNNHGQLFKNLALGEELLLDRLLNVDGKSLLAICTISAADKLSEVSSAMKVTEMKRILADKFPGTILMTVSIGYTSDEISELLSVTGQLINFDEESFAKQLTGIIANAIAMKNSNSPSPTEGQVNQELQALLIKMSQKLESMEQVRRKDENTTQTYFKAENEHLSRERFLNKKKVTRWEIIEQLDALRVKLERGKIQEQRDIVRSILIANETSLKLKQLDLIGEMYLDKLASDHKPEDVKVLENLIIKMRKSVHNRSLMNRICNAPWKAFLSSTFVSTITMLIVLLMMAIENQQNTKVSPSKYTEDAINSQTLNVSSFFFELLTTYQFMLLMIPITCGVFVYFINFLNVLKIKKL